MTYNKKGWKQESARHSLAAKGIKTSKKNGKKWLGRRMRYVKKIVIGVGAVTGGLALGTGIMTGLYVAPTITFPVLLLVAGAAGASRKLWKRSHEKGTPQRVVDISKIDLKTEKRKWATVPTIEASGKKGKIKVHIPTLQAQMKTKGGS